MIEYVQSLRHLRLQSHWPGAHVPVHATVVVDAILLGSFGYSDVHSVRGVSWRVLSRLFPEPFQARQSVKNEDEEQEWI